MSKSAACSGRFPKASALNKKGDSTFMKKKIYSVCALLIALAMIFSFAACDSLGAEEETTTEPPIVSKTPMPTTTEGVVNYFNSLINTVKAAKPGTKMDQTNKNVSDVICGEEERETSFLKARFPLLRSIFSKKRAARLSTARICLTSSPSRVRPGQAS